MGFVTIFWNNNVKEAYLPKMSISAKIVPEILAQLCSENSIQTLPPLGGMLGLIYVCVSSSTDAHHMLYFIFWLDISFSNKYTLFLYKCHKNSYDISGQMSKLGFFLSQSHTSRDLRFSGESQQDQDGWTVSQHQPCIAYRRVQGFESRMTLNFFWLSFRQLKLWWFCSYIPL